MNTLAYIGGRRYTPDQIREIRRRYEDGQTGKGPLVTYLSLAEDFGHVSRQTICAIIKRKIYRDVPDLPGKTRAA